MVECFVTNEIVPSSTLGIRSNFNIEVIWTNLRNLEYSTEK